MNRVVQDLVFFPLIAIAASCLAVVNVGSTALVGVITAWRYVWNRR